MKLSANGFLQAVLTMQSDEPIAVGTPVKLTGSFEVEAAGSGDAFCGVVCTSRDTICGVQLRGSVCLPYSSDAPAVGFAVLACDGEGGVTAAESGTNVLVLSVDTDAKTITCLL
ncbi:MAG: hypothetical protein IKW76_07040 [Clostridia bacterium]|nr:hypothetical protein [Clostridia bacterium]